MARDERLRRRGSAVRQARRLLATASTVLAAVVCAGFGIRHRGELPEVFDALADARPTSVALCVGLVVAGALNHAGVHRATRRAVGLHATSWRDAIVPSVGAGCAARLVRSGGAAAFGVFLRDAHRRGLPRGSVTAAYLVAVVLVRSAYAASAALLLAHWWRGPAAAAAVAGAVIVAGAGVVVLVGRACRPVPSTVLRHRWVAPVVAEVRRLRRRPTDLARAATHAGAVEVLNAVLLWSALVAVDIEVGPGEALGFYAACSLATLLSVLPAGLGTVEIALVAAIAEHGVDGRQAAAAVALYRLFQLWLPVAMGGVVLLGSTGRPARRRRATRPQPTLTPMTARARSTAAAARGAAAST